MSSADASFKSFAQLCQTLEGARSRKEKVALISSYLKSLTHEDASLAAQFLTGRALPEQASKRLEVGGATLWRLARTRGLQTPLFQSPLTLRDLAETLDRIGSLQGKGVQLLRENLLQGILNRASGLERKYLLKIISGEMQIGVVDGLVLEALGHLTGVPLEDVRRGFMLVGNIRQLALNLLQDPRALSSLRVQPFHPLKPMLAEMAADISQALREHARGTQFEFKLDGARIQIHKKGDSIRIFSRNLADVTESLPDVQTLLKTELKTETTVLEGELVAVDNAGRPLPFQDLMRRFRRLRGILQAATHVPLKLYLFDILLLGDRQLIDEPLTQRRRILETTISPQYLTEAIRSSDPAQIDAFLRRALEAGHEGLMAKALDSTYTIGARGKKWFKIKPAQTLDLTIVAADWGYGRRTGWLSNYHLAALNEDDHAFMEVGKTFKGLTDEEFQAMTRHLQETKTSEDGFTVHVKPETVVEVAFNEIQKSPHYPSGFALRFARILRIREDKDVAEIDTLATIRRLYQEQFRAKGRITTDPPLKDG